MAKYFLDANIILDLIDSDRGNVERTRTFARERIVDGDTLCTSCDIFTTVYYVASKKLSSTLILAELKKLLVFVDVVPITIDTIMEAMKLLSGNEDFEDLIQYVCALQSSCDRIVTNDKKFYRGKIELLSIAE